MRTDCLDADDFLGSGPTKGCPQTPETHRENSVRRFCAKTGDLHGETSDERRVSHQVGSAGRSSPASPTSVLTLDQTHWPEQRGGLSLLSGAFKDRS